MLIVHIFKKKKQTVTCFPWEVISSGTELSPSLSLFLPSPDHHWEGRKGGAVSVDSRLTG